MAKEKKPVKKHSQSELDHAFQTAVIHGLISEALLILKAGANIDAQPKDPMLPNSPSQTALQMIIDSRHDGHFKANMIKFLLDNGADPNVDSGDGSLPLLSTVSRIIVIDGGILKAQHTRNQDLLDYLNDSHEQHLSIVHNLILNGADLD